jgi:hypothetical protein
MRPQDLGFADPCQSCIEYVLLGLRTGSQSINSYLQGHGTLQSLPVDDMCSHEGFYYRYVCSACTSRWVIFEWGGYGWVNLEQESADGRYYKKANYEEGRKHGWHECYPRFYPANERNAPIVLAELWDRGRLIKRLEEGRLVFDAEGKCDATGRSQSNRPDH